MIIKVARQDFSLNVAFLVEEERYEGARMVAKPLTLTMETVNEGDFIEPTFTIPMSACQSLIDGLWDAGLRPTEGTGSAGSLRATEKHLDDMRKIVGKQLEVEF